MVIPQATQPPPAAPVETRGRDEIVLEGGEKILGRVLKQTGTYIEIRLDQNTVVGFNRSRVTRITRGRASAPPSARARLSPRDGWYLLHAGDGRTLGYLHGLVQRTQDGGLQLTEEWFFGGEKETTRITLVEAVSPDLIPLSSFYHERVLDRSGRMLTEEIRRGIVEGAQLRVDWRSLRGRERRTYPMPEGVRFPMSMREEIRQSHDISIHAANQQVFDVTTGQFKILRASSVQRREVEIGQRVALVREVLIEDGGRQNREWMDRNCQVLRREINGVALVASLSTREQALRVAVNPREGTTLSAIATSADGSLGLWMPNPVWRHRSSRDGIVTVEAPLFGACASLVEFSHLDSDLQPQSAADAVLRWLRLGVGQGMKVVERCDVQVRGLPAVKLGLRWRVERVGESARYWGVCHVLRHEGRFVAFFHGVPRENYQAVEADVARLLGSVQLGSEDLSPTLQGPLAKPVR